jgi:hypothetical protein
MTPFGLCFADSPLVTGANVLERRQGPRRRKARHCARASSTIRPACGHRSKEKKTRLRGQVASVSVPAMHRGSGAMDTRSDGRISTSGARRRVDDAIAAGRSGAPHRRAFAQHQTSVFPEHHGNRGAFECAIAERRFGPNGVAIETPVTLVRFAGAWHSEGEADWVEPYSTRASVQAVVPRRDRARAAARWCRGTTAPAARRRARRA